jgi:hypothetical protein
MIHARQEGESFGLSIGEFSTCNKPVITSKSCIDNAHVNILKNKGIYYLCKESLDFILQNCRQIIKSRTDNNAYIEYTPEKVMKIFNTVFFNKIEYNDMTGPPKTFGVVDKVTLVTAFFDIGRGDWQNNFNRSSETYISQFYKYLELDYNLIVFMDARYTIPHKQNMTIIPIDHKFLENEIHGWKQLDRDKSIINSEVYKKYTEHRINNGHPENIYAEYNCIMHAKIDFINYAVKHGYIKHGTVCWSDFGTFKNFGETLPTKPLDSLKMNTSKINLFLRNKLTNYDKDPYYTLEAAPERVTGTFFSLPISLVSEFQELYHRTLEELYSLCISDDDQHILLRCYYKKPYLFELFIDTTKWPQGLVYLQ